MKAMVPVRGLEGLYSVNFFGAVYSHRAEKFLRPEIMKDRYLRYTLIGYDGQKIRRQAHVFELESYSLRDSGNHEVNHKDHVRDNNWIGNLEWVSKQRNIEHGKSRSFIVTFPDGTREKIFNLSKFCREYGLHLGAMHEMATGRVREGRSPRSHHKGYRCEYDQEYTESGEW